MKTGTQFAFVYIASIVLFFPSIHTEALEENFAGRDSQSFFGFDPQPMPRIPPKLLLAGITTGRIKIVVEVDSYGELRDYLILDASHKELVPALRKAIRQWKFYPPKREGAPATITEEIMLHFKTEGTFLAFDFSRTSQIAPTDSLNSQSPRTADWQDLDQLPNPVSVVTPVVPRELVKSKPGRWAKFKFFIDTEGRVRLPHVWQVDRELDDRVLLEVQDSLRRWVFDKPAVKGHPVIVPLYQVFHF